MYTVFYKELKIPTSYFTNSSKGAKIANYVLFFKASSIYWGLHACLSWLQWS